MRAALNDAPIALKNELRALSVMLIGIIGSVPACGARSGLGASDHDRPADSGVLDTGDAGSESGRADGSDDGGFEAGTPDVGTADSADSGFVSTLEVAASAVNTYFLTPHGGVKSCGENAAGQLGDGTYGPPRARPGDVIGLTGGIKAIAAGSAHACALTDSGRVMCWGAGGYGELGDGSSGSSHGTAIAQPVPGLADVTAITAGQAHTCALLATGVVNCWGENSLYQCGSEAHGLQSHPGEVSGLSGVTAIAANGFHTCALTVAGKVKCWGSNHWGELGYGGLASSKPIEVGLKMRAVAISVGGWHSCAVGDTGAAYCWGSNWNGQLGNGTTTHSFTPAPVMGLGSDIVSIASGSRNSCAVTSAGVPLCWGANDEGQLGRGTIGADALTPGNVVGISGGIERVATGFAHTCVVTTSGRVECWGRNSFGALGDGTIGPDRGTPADVIGL